MMRLALIVALVLLSGCAAQATRCDAHLRPINVVAAPPAPAISPGKRP